MPYLITLNIKYNLSKTSPVYLSCLQQVHMLDTVKLKHYYSCTVTKASMQGRINHCLYGRSTKKSKYSA